MSDCKGSIQIEVVNTLARDRRKLQANDLDAPSLTKKVSSTRNTPMGWVVVYLNIYISTTSHIQKFPLSTPIFLNCLEYIIAHKLPPLN